MAGVYLSPVFYTDEQTPLNAARTNDLGAVVVRLSRTFKSVLAVGTDVS